MSDRLKHEEYMDNSYDGGDEQFAAIGGTKHNNYMRTPSWRKPKNYDEEKPFFDVCDKLEINDLNNIPFRYFEDKLIFVVDERNQNSHSSITNIFEDNFILDFVYFEYPLI